MITMHRGQHVRWYVMSMGTEVDLHTPHWHGNTVTVERDADGRREPAAGERWSSPTWCPTTPGIWLFHCHVNDHIRAGMLTRYKVLA